MHRSAQQSSVSFDILRLYENLLNRAKSRIKIPVEKHSLDTLSSFTSSLFKPASSSEIKVEASQAPALVQTIVNLRHIITVLDEDNSKRLKPILVATLNWYEKIARRNQITITGDELPLHNYNGDELVNSDVKQCRGFLEGVKALKGLASLTKTEVRPSFDSIINELQKKYDKIKPKPEDRRRSEALVMGPR